VSYFARRDLLDVALPVRVPRLGSFRSVAASVRYAAGSAAAGGASWEMVGRDERLVDRALPRRRRAGDGFLTRFLPSIAASASRNRDS